MDNKNILIGIGVVVLVIGAYLIGQGSSTSTLGLSTDAAQTQNTNSNIPAQNATLQQAVSKPLSQQPIAPPPAQPVASNIDANIITNSVPCEEIANEALKNEEASKLGGGIQNATVLQAHFSTNGGCYYEFSYTYTDTGVHMTILHYAPTDGWVADCSDTPSQPSVETTCYQNGTGFISETVFHLIEANLLSN